MHQPTNKLLILPPPLSFAVLPLFRFIICVVVLEVVISQSVLLGQKRLRFPEIDTIQVLVKLVRVVSHLFKVLHTKGHLVAAIATPIFAGLFRFVGGDGNGGLECIANLSAPLLC